jgi:RHS repeat-associated protein
MQPAETVLSRYQYDALDRLAAATPLVEAKVQRIYQKNRLSVEIQGAVHRRVMQFDDHVLAEQRAAETVLPATDLQRSVLHSVDARGQHDIAYSPYGHRPNGIDVFSLLGFAGERPDPVTRHYPLGNGYRSYNPVLMRFNQPDSLSPFGEGGVNAYAYCQGDPVNRSDPTGHTSVWLSLMQWFSGRRSTPSSASTPTLNRMPPSTLPKESTVTPSTPPSGRAGRLTAADGSYSRWKEFFTDVPIKTIQANFDRNYTGINREQAIRLLEMKDVSIEGRNLAAIEVVELRKNAAMDIYLDFTKQYEKLRLSSRTISAEKARVNELLKGISDARQLVRQYKSVTRLIRSQ